MERAADCEQMTGKPEVIGPNSQFLVAHNPGVGPSMATSAFVGTNPTGELITFGLLITRSCTEKSQRGSEHTL